MNNFAVVPWSTQAYSTFYEIVKKNVLWHRWPEWHGDRDADNTAKVQRAAKKKKNKKKRGLLLTENDIEETVLSKGANYNSRLQPITPGSSTFLQPLSNIEPCSHFCFTVAKATSRCPRRPLFVFDFFSRTIKKNRVAGHICVSKSSPTVCRQSSTRLPRQWGFLFF